MPLDAVQMSDVYEHEPRWKVTRPAVKGMPSPHTTYFATREAALERVAYIARRYGCTVKLEPVANLSQVD
jgi:hypothetical protein